MKTFTLFVVLLLVLSCFNQAEGHTLHQGFWQKLGRRLLGGKHSGCSASAVASSASQSKSALAIATADAVGQAVASTCKGGDATAVVSVTANAIAQATATAVAESYAKASVAGGGCQPGSAASASASSVAFAVAKAVAVAYVDAVAVATNHDVQAVAAATASSIDKDVEHAVTTALANAVVIGTGVSEQVTRACATATAAACTQAIADVVATIDGTKPYCTAFAGASAVSSTSVSTVNNGGVKCTTGRCGNKSSSSSGSNPGTPSTYRCGDLSAGVWQTMICNDPVKWLQFQDACERKLCPPPIA